MKSEFLSRIVSKASRIAYRGKITLKEHSPELLLIGGTVAIVGGVVLACKETLKLEEIVDEHAKVMEEIEKTHELNPSGYTEADVKHDKVVQISRTVVKVVKLYAPAATSLLTGFACIFGAHKLLRTRNAALLAAYKALEAEYEQYRKKVIEKEGEDADLDYRTGAKKIKEINGTEDCPVKPGDYIILDGTPTSIYARFFDSSNPHWVNDMDCNLAFITAQETTCTRLINRRGALMLNDAFDILGFKRSTAAGYTGWLSKEYGGKDGYADFQIKHVWKRPYSNEASNNYQQGWEHCLLLDFNVDGVILDKLDFLNKTVSVPYAMA